MRHTSHGRTFASRGFLLSVLVLSVVTSTALTSKAIRPQLKSGDVDASLVSSARLAQTVPNLPVYFVENHGQTDPSVKFYIEGKDHQVYFREDGITLADYQKKGDQYDRSVTTVNFVNRNTDSTVEAVAEAVTRVSYFFGDKRGTHPDIPTATKITYHDLWEGIDLELQGDQGNLKYVFIVHPGANPSDIALDYRGAELALDAAGNLLIDNTIRTFTDKAPIAWQDQAERRTNVSVSYSLTPTSDATRVAFTTGSFDHTHELIIDPIIIEWAALAGGPDYDGAISLAVDATGIYYGAYGGSAISSFPGAPGYDTSFNSIPPDGDAYVFKLTHDGTTALYATYVGGSAEEGINGLDIDASGNAYFVTNTHSADFPTTPGVIDTSYAATIPEQWDATVTKLSPDGTTLVYSTYFGGTASEIPLDIAVDSTGEAVIVGQGGDIATGCTTACPTIGPDTTYNGGTGDFFIGRLNSSATFPFDYLGFIGGSAAERCCNMSVTVDGTGTAYVAGETASANFPTTLGAFDTSDNAGTETGIVSIDATGTLTAGTYLGGSGDDYGAELVLGNGSLYAFGGTTSTESSVPDAFPVSGGPDLSHNGGYDVFITRLSTDLTTVTSSGFFGGTGDEWIENGADIDSNGDVYIGAVTNSLEPTIPLVDGPDLDQNGGMDALVAKFDGTTLGLDFSGYVGGTTNEYLYEMKVYSPNVLYGAAESYSTESSLPNGYGFYSIPGIDQTNAGDSDAFVFKVSEVPAAITVTESGGSTDISEIGPTSDDYTVVLESRPTFDVTVAITPDAQQTADQVSLTFTPLNWDVPQLVNVTAVQDAIPECPHAGLITHTASSADLNYDGIATASVVPNITDITCGTPAITVTESSGSTDINEAGPTSDDYSVVLESQPSADVNVAITTNAQQITDLANLTFTPLNWNIPQPVITTAVDDTLIECPHTGLITHTATSADINYDGIATASVVPNITDNDCKTFTDDDPLDQAIEISQSMFPDGSADAVVVGRNDLMADPFVGTPLAASLNAPLLLNEPDHLNPKVLAEIQRVLGDPADPIYLLGRERALSDDIVTELAAAGLPNTVRLGGIDRDETAVKIGDVLIARHPAPVTKVFMTEDERLVDSFVIGTVAANQNDGLIEPIILTDRGSNTLNQFAADFITQHAVARLELIGGESAISSAVEASLFTDYPSLTSISRLNGPTRYETAEAVASAYFPTPAAIAVASGERSAIPGALSESSKPTTDPLYSALLASGLAASLDGPLLITRRDEVPAAIYDYVSDHQSTITQAYFVGAPDQLSQAVIDAILNLLQ